MGVRSKSAEHVAASIEQFCDCMKKYEESPFFSFLTVDGKLNLPFASFADGLIFPTTEQVTVNEELHIHESIVASCASLIAETERLEKRGILTNPKLLVVVVGDSDESEHHSGGKANRIPG